MEPVRPRRFAARGIIHCHSDLSYDCKTRLADLCVILRREGFSFVALTEHVKGVSPEDYDRFVAQCRKETNGSFVVIPGLEVRCGDGIEVAAVGVSELVNSGPPDEVVSHVRNLGGYAVWVHPLKRGRWMGRLLGCDAIEVMNGKVDGTVAPDLALLRRVRKCRRMGAGVHAIFGLDMHDLDQPREVWVECKVPALTPAHVVQSLRDGAYVNRVARGAVSSSGEIALFEHLWLLILRWAFIAWNAVCEVVPTKVLTVLIRVSRPFVRMIKNG